ncbi:helix-turn-helix domain-containing protein [Roseixanthobacter liquoris]|uniref:helix-turn-helix domain-containing protein n=1 Tax=Roseixanthobacter liquoris TaxID=3119921 RepID=UPI00372D57E8
MAAMTRRRLNSLPEHACRLTAETILIDRPMRPQQVAARWGCSEKHVRNLITDGALGHFRLGGRLLRIRASAVEEYERCQTRNTRSDGSTAGGSSPGGKAGSGNASALRRALANRWSARNAVPEER